MIKLAPYTGLLSRRKALGLFGAATLLGCNGEDDSSSSTGSTAGAGTTSGSGGRFRIGQLRAHPAGNGRTVSPVQ